MTNVTELKSKTPAAYLHDGGVKRKAGRNLAKLAMEAWETRMELEALKERLSACNEKIVKAVNPGCAIEIPGMCRVTVAERQTVRVTDVEALEHVLGPRFEDLVDVRVNHRPLPKLVEMAADGDDPLGKAVRQALSFEHSVTVSYRPAK